MNCRSYRNLIHSTEPGNEYEEQFRRLFPELQPDALQRVRDCGVIGAVCYSPDYAMERTHRLRSAIFSAGMFCVGGSNGLLDWGRNSVSEEMHDALVASLGAQDQTRSPMIS